MNRKTVLFGESGREEHCWRHVTCHMTRTHTAIPASITPSSSVAPASLRSCLRAAALTICRYAPQAWSTTGRCCLQVRWWLGLGCNRLWCSVWLGLGCSVLLYMVGRVLCAIIALHVRLQARTPTRLKPFLSPLWMRTVPSKRIARARQHAITKRTRAPCTLLILAPHTSLLCAMRPRHVRCVRARICIEQLLHRTARDALTVQTHLTL